jgi:hypothetical protein
VGTIHVSDLAGDRARPGVDHIDGRTPADFAELPSMSSRSSSTASVSLTAAPGCGWGSVLGVARVDNERRGGH